jgi:hypothetical protein
VKTPPLRNFDRSKRKLLGCRPEFGQRPGSCRGLAADVGRSQSLYKSVVESSRRQAGRIPFADLSFRIVRERKSHTFATTLMKDRRVGAYRSQAFGVKDQRYGLRATQCLKPGKYQHDAPAREFDVNPDGQPTASLARRVRVSRAAYRTERPWLRSGVTLSFVLENETTPISILVRRTTRLTRRGQAQRLDNRHILRLAALECFQPGCGFRQIGAAGKGRPDKPLWLI